MLPTFRFFEYTACPETPIRFKTNFEHQKVKIDLTKRMLTHNLIIQNVKSSKVQFFYNIFGIKENITSIFLLLFSHIMVYYYTRAEFIFNLI